MQKYAHRHETYYRNFENLFGERNTLVLNDHLILPVDTFRWSAALQIRLTIEYITINKVKKLIAA